MKCGLYYITFEISLYSRTGSIVHRLGVGPIINYLFSNNNYYSSIVTPLLTKMARAEVVPPLRDHNPDIPVGGRGATARLHLALRSASGGSPLQAPGQRLLPAPDGRRLCGCIQHTIMFYQ